MEVIDFFGGAERDRTADLLVANEALSQLSYSPPPDAHHTPPSRVPTPSNDISECTSNSPAPQTQIVPTRPVTAVSAASGFSTTCHTSPAASATTLSTGTTSFTPLGAIASNVPISPGRNFSLAETIKLGVDAKNAFAMWGPYEIRKEGFDLGVRRKKLLDGGTIKYRADDRLYRKDKVAISCFHAMAGLEELYPNGGIFGTGFKMWGFNGTARVLIEYSNKAHYKGLLLDPVDVKKDKTVFVYAPAKNGRVPYLPAKQAIAYHS